MRVYLVLIFGQRNRAGKGESVNETEQVRAIRLTNTMVPLNNIQK